MKKFILILTNYFDPTTDLIIRNFNENFRNLDVKIVRWNVDEFFDDFQVKVFNDEFVARILSSNLEFSSKNIQSVLYRRPIFPKSKASLQEVRIFEAREARAVIEGIYGFLENATWYSKIESIEASRNKINQLFIAKKLGFNVPEYFIISGESGFPILNVKYEDYIIKSINPANCLIENERQQGILKTVRCSGDLIAKYFSNGRVYPIMLQKEIKKQLEYRVTVIGADIISIAIDTKQCEYVDTREYWKNSKHLMIDLPSKLKEKIIEFQKFYGLNYGAFDFIEDEQGVFWFLECNPVGQFAWIDFKMSNVNIVKNMVEHLILEKEPLL